MAPRRRRSRRRRRARRWPFVLGSALFTLALALAIIFADLPHRPPADDRPVPGTSLGADTLGEAATLPRPDRPIYPYSIVEGGVETVDKLHEQMARDPVVAAHFRDFDLSKARIERLETPRVAHVSYRMNDAVYWTRKRVVVPAGETILTDGVIEARTRCANQLAFEPGPVSDDEPDPAVLETPRLPLRPVGLVLAGTGASILNGAVPVGTTGPDGVGPIGVMPALYPSAGSVLPPSVSSNSHVPAAGDPAQAPARPIREIPEPGLTVLMLAVAAAAARVTRRAASRV
jgi:hypothetical protein